MSATEQVTIRILMPLDDHFPPPSEDIIDGLNWIRKLCKSEHKIPNQSTTKSAPPREMSELVSAMMADLMQTLRFDEALVIDDTEGLPEEMIGAADGGALVCIEGRCNSTAEQAEIHAYMILNYFAEASRRGVYGFDVPVGMIWVRPCGDYSVITANSGFGGES